MDFRTCLRVPSPLESYSSWSRAAVFHITALCVEKHRGTAQPPQEQMLSRRATRDRVATGAMFEESQVSEVPVAEEAQERRSRERR
jgi:hypothetical protein